LSVIHHLTHNYIADSGVVFMSIRGPYQTQNGSIVSSVMFCLTT